MKMSVFYDHIVDASTQTGKSVQDILYVCNKAGIEAVEINHESLKQNYDKICMELNKASMHISCIYEFFDWGRNSDFASGEKLIQTAVDLKVNRVLIIPGFLDEEDGSALDALHDSYEKTAEYMEKHVQIQNMKKMLTQMTALASEKNIAVSLEDFDGKTAPFARTWQLLWFMRNVPNLQFTLDMGNFIYSDEDVSSAYDVLADYIVHVHCKDRGTEPGKEFGTYNKGMQAVPTGSGYLPIEYLLKKLKKQNYDGYLAIEHYNAPDQEKFMLESALYLLNNW